MNVNLPILGTNLPHREGLSEQRALAEEIGNAIANGPQAGEPIDEGELEDELGRLEQEDLDEKMLKTGTVPVLPSGLNGPRKCSLSSCVSDDEECDVRVEGTQKGSGKSRCRAETFDALLMGRG